MNHATPDMAPAPLDRFSRRVFLAAGIYGLIVLLPMYAMEQRIGQDDPPQITHPEYFYGFLGVAVAWQAAFLVMARDPARYRWIMLPAVLEKFSFALAAAVLFQSGRVPGTILGAGMLDLAWGLLFVAAFRRTRSG